MPDLVSLLRRLADEYETAERSENGDAQAQATEERIAALEANTSGRDWAAAFKDLSPEDRRAIREALDIAPDPPSDPSPDPAASGDGTTPRTDEEIMEGDPPRRTRPGRKRGRVYQYRTDPDGRVLEASVPVVYNGEDEPEEVELPPDDEPAS